MFKGDPQYPELGPSELVDNFGRKIDYLRLSVTDRCNLRCFYCSACDGLKSLSHQEILTYEECLSLIGLSYSLNVGKVRLTGGEPFARKDFIDFLNRIVELFPEIDLRVTTNGTLLEGRILRLKEIGLSGLNISLDTLQRDKYARITGRDFYPRVRKAIDDCLEQGIRVKLNVVAMKGVNDSELSDFIQLAMNNPLDVRFIEFMPIGKNTNWKTDCFWPAHDIVGGIKNITALQAVSEQKKASGPARMYKLTSGQGRVGVISPLSQHFCGHCNRFRITSDGKLRTCLFSDKEYRLRPLLRSNRFGLEKVLKVMKLASIRKPMGYKLLKDGQEDISVCKRFMSTIGG